MLRQLHHKYYGEILPYLGTTKNNYQEDSTNYSVEVPNLEGLTFSQAKKELNELGIEAKIDENVDLESIVSEQTPKKGIQISSNSSVILK